MYLIFGKFPIPLLERSRKGRGWFDIQTALPREELLPLPPPATFEAVFSVLMEVEGQPPPSEELLSFLKKMLVIDPAERASAHELLSHPWLTSTT
ncbi:hypothetical protein BDP27DRAFT_1421371 [Rhodocollybia butyracea]|uniref:Protein kinase domain-containing protein n=1 Tax=Rhodocollybia butyracea TaxID=206335 RepID=A0A9P5U7K3_9AGAR|nr:hypothetical protein BDP27DRAFT_1421371 [Rhodocollybia butyracea]